MNAALEPLLSLNPLAVPLKTCPVGADVANEPEGIVTVSGTLLTAPLGVPGTL
ncbi:MAG TPA: hypothetical protein VFE60_02565 [Roseiarcus sp.]|nr:hypothetical protein [Roseiarcus sp.]